MDYLKSRAAVARDIVRIDPGAKKVFAQAVWGAYKVFFAVVLIVLVLIIAAHVIPAEIAKGNPPLACQVFGGHWSLWNGWRCG